MAKDDAKYRKTNRKWTLANSLDALCTHRSVVCSRIVNNGQLPPNNEATNRQTSTNTRISAASDSSSDAIRSKWLNFWSFETLARGYNTFALSPNVWRCTEWLHITGRRGSHRQSIWNDRRDTPDLVGVQARSFARRIHRPARTAWHRYSNYTCKLPLTFSFPFKLAKYKICSLDATSGMVMSSSVSSRLRGRCSLNVLACGWAGAGRSSALATRSPSGPV